VAKKSIHHLDFSTLALINKEVVSLTKEPHEFTQEDEERIWVLLEDVGSKGNDKEFKEAIIEKASLLIYRIARGQHFHEGNKRTALVAGSAFLQMNGYSIDIKNRELVSVIDRAGIASASLNDVSGCLSS
jgi:death-on-curing protein